MSRDVPNIIRWDQAYTRNGDGKLPRAAVHCIRTYMDNDTLEGFVKRETIAQDTGLSIRQVDRQIAANIKAGWLKITSKGHSGGKANDFKLMFPTEIESDMSLKERQICPSNRDRYVSPTSPTTSPSTVNSRRDTSVSIDWNADLKGSAGDAPFGVEPTTPSNRDIYVSIPSLKNGERLEAEKKLFAALPALAKATQKITGLPSAVHQQFMKALITEGEVYHDTDTKMIYRIEGTNA